MPRFESVPPDTEPRQHAMPDRSSQLSTRKNPKTRMVSPVEKLLRADAGLCRGSDRRVRQTFKPLVDFKGPNRGDPCTMLGSGLRRKLNETMSDGACCNSGDRIQNDSRRSYDACTFCALANCGCPRPTAAPTLGADVYFVNGNNLGRWNWCTDVAELAQRTRRGTVFADF